ncbi:hypothetical protein JHW43_003014 [Diplocarpon mali]|nr:hypothetical protein JHW43_003014 [Diplocarpon mali]
MMDLILYVPSSSRNSCLDRMAASVCSISYPASLAAQGIAASHRSSTPTTSATASSVTDLIFCVSDPYCPLADIVQSSKPDIASMAAKNIATPNPTFTSPRAVIWNMEHALIHKMIVAASAPPSAEHTRLAALQAHFAMSQSSLKFPRFMAIGDLGSMRNFVARPAYHHFPTTFAAPQNAIHGVFPARMAAKLVVKEGRKFTVFKKLPLEMQYMIWSIAIATQHQEKRLLRVARDSPTLERTIDNATTARLLIISDIYRRKRLVPTLLHTCKYSRQEALKNYELWGCVDPLTFEMNKASVYVKLDIYKDIFFFGDAPVEDFWLLDTLINSSSPSSAKADDEARHIMLPQLSYIKHFAFDWELWCEILETEALWLCNLDSAKEITVAIRNPNHEQSEVDYALCRLRSVQPGTWPDESIKFTIATLSMDNSASEALGNTAKDELYLEEVLVYAPSPN